MNHPHSRYRTGIAYGRDPADNDILRSWRDRKLAPAARTVDDLVDDPDRDNGDLCFNCGHSTPAIADLCEMCAEEEGLT